jgi:uncharacterized hydrophobic protein (TIGR00271 family)
VSAPIPRYLLHIVKGVLMEKKTEDVKLPEKGTEGDAGDVSPQAINPAKPSLFARAVKYFGLEGTVEKKEDDFQEKEPKNKHHPDDSDDDDETTLSEKITSQTKEVKGIFEHVIEPEERNLKNFLNVNFWKKKREEYKKLKEKEEEDYSVHRKLSDGAKPSIEYYILTSLSAVIATAGLIQGSTAIVIGAMIVAPLMTPILAFSLAVIWGDLNLIKNSTISILRGTFLSVVISAGIVFFVPISGYSNEILSRTRPDLFDIIVAIASGVVGAYGYANKKISNTLVGIAIAVALMPPLCTIGIGIGTFNLDMTLGATTLFLINLISISLSSATVFWMMKIHPVLADEDMVKKRAIHQIIISVVILTVIAVPVGFFMLERYSVETIKRSAKTFVDSEITDTTVYDMKVVKTDKGNVLFMTLKGSKIPKKDKIMELKESISSRHYNLADVKIEFILTLDL